MKKNILLWILLAFIVIGFLTLPRNILINDDAANYALVVKNIVLSNEWLAPLVTPGDTASFMDKPPLGIWLLAWIPKLAGVNELTVHIPNVIYFTLLLGLIYFSLARYGAKKIALLSTLIAATSLGLVVYSRAPKLDILLTLFITLANFSLYAFIKEGKKLHLYLFSIALACGFLIKTGFGIIFPGLTLISILVFHARSREKVFKFVFSGHFIFSLIIFTLIIGSILGLQAAALKEYWLPYLKSITLQSKYNTSYLGFGFYYPIIGYILLAIFPWGAVCLPMLLRRKNVGQALVACQNSGKGQALALHKISIREFCLHWFWSGVLFLLFFYKQNDLRTFVVFIPPLAILGGIRLSAYDLSSKINLASLLWNALYMLIFTVIFTVLVLKPVNQDGIQMNAVIEPLFWFVAFLYMFFIYLLRPNKKVLITALFVLVLGYATLFYNTPRIAAAFNPDYKWPGIIEQQKKMGVPFYIYRSRDRDLFYNPDLTYVDFMAGPADEYFWDSASLKYKLKDRFSLILSDTKSLEKLGITYETVARDSYSSLVRCFGRIK